MLGITLALLSAAASGLSVVIVGRHIQRSNSFNVSILISAVGLVILWPLAIVLTDFGTANLEGVALFALGGLLTPGLVRLFYYSGLRKLGLQSTRPSSQYTHYTAHFSRCYSLVKSLPYKTGLEYSPSQSASSSSNSVQEK